MDASQINRRAFLKYLAANLAAFAIPLDLPEQTQPAIEYPKIELSDLPEAVQRILSLTPRVLIDSEGYLRYFPRDGRPAGRVPLARTLWNRERDKIYDRLYTHVPWGIVLHWYGDRDGFDKSLAGYLRGFDSLREADGYQYRTSAHFLVGAATPTAGVDAHREPIGIFQMQDPDKDGIPFVASHLKSLDLQAHQERRQYFVRALYQLHYANRRVHSLLQDLFDGPRLDPNMRTIAIEITGFDFENPANMPGEQQVANVVGLIWAVMKRYRIPSSNLLGHHEIQLGKADPGKKFMSLIRYLLGVKALLESDDTLKDLVFSQFHTPGGDPAQAVREYFQFVRDYFVMVSTPRKVYEWEGLTKFWGLEAKLRGLQTASLKGEKWLRPIQGSTTSLGSRFLDPENHEGVDLYADQALDKVGTSTAIHLAAQGVCLYTGLMEGCRLGHMAIFRHRPLDAAEVLTVYGHLNSLGEVQVGRSYSQGHPLGSIEKGVGHYNPFLHYAVAYGATWNTDLGRQPRVPRNVGASWIRDRYLDPSEHQLG